MVKKGTLCIILLIILLFLVTFLQIYTDNFLSSIKNKIDKIEISIENNSEQVDNNETSSLVLDLKNYWEEKIPYICLMMNYNDIAPIGEAISRLEAGIEANDYISSNIETKQISRITGALQKIFNFRLPNLL